MDGVPKQSWFSPKIEVRRSSAHGRGTFAKEPIGKGEIVEVWGEFVEGRQTVEYTSDFARVDKARSAGKTVMQWDSDLYSIEERGSDEGYFLNHSCDPNLWFRDAFTLIARRVIPQGEELTLDYALFEADSDAVVIAECRCGSRRCRHRVTGSDWQLQELQRTYGAHFTPLLNQRIADAPGSG